MKRFLLASATLLGAASALLAPPAAAADVGVSISVGEPGFYGRIDIGGYPPPTVIYPQPVVVAPAPMPGPPIYLRVPPGYAKHWSRHCHEYNACGERVYFVRDNWYRNEYAPRYREMHREHGYQEHHDERGYEGHGHYQDHDHGPEHERDSGR